MSPLRNSCLNGDTTRRSDTRPRQSQSSASPDTHLIRVVCAERLDENSTARTTATCSWRQDLPRLLRRHFARTSRRAATRYCLSFRLASPAGEALTDNLSKSKQAGFTINKATRYPRDRGIERPPRSISFSFLLFFYVFSYHADHASRVGRNA